MGPSGTVASPAAFISGLNEILWVGSGVAAVGAALALVLVRKQDFLASGPPPQAALEG